MDACIAWGSVSLGPTGLVAFLPCGHWWAYPVRVTLEQMHEVARFNCGLACSFWLAGWQAIARVQAPETATLVN